MDIFDMMGKHEHEQLVFWNEPNLGYKGIIAIHDTTLGPALGGTRFWNYPTEEEAIVDALRLSRGMTYKAAVAGLDLGGGKSVIWGDNRLRDREMIFRAHGRAVESLGGRYITAEDVGTSPDDMEYVLSETGHVGYYLCQDLHEAGARLSVTDIDPQRVGRVVSDFGATAVATDDIYAVEADIFAPCALGAIVNDHTLEVFQVPIIAGGANNQLARAEHAQKLHERGILYAPDYVINAGGLINVYGELHDWSPERSKRKAGEIYQTLLRIFETAQEQDIPTAVAADRVAEDRIQRSRHLQRSWV